MERIGTWKRPAVLRVGTPERAERVMAVCREHGVHFVIGVESHQPEDLTDLERALDPSPDPVRDALKPGRDDPCPCGSGRKARKCCLELMV